MAGKTRFRVAIWLGPIFLVGFLAIQFHRPALTNPPVTAEIEAPPEVKAVLRNSCYDCHSNETKLPWYDEMAPAYWKVAEDVEHGRRHLNFSEIGKLHAAQQKAAVWEAVNQIQLGAMPLPEYVVVHRGAKVTPEQL